MQPILAIVRLTFQAALRFRLLPLLCVLLVTAVIALPMLVKHDGTAQGFVQIILTYTLASIMGLLGFATVWLACGTLAGDVEDAQIQMVVVKPIARWQIWIGKWLGILLLDAILLGIAAAAVFGMLKWRASQLSPEAQAALRKQIMVADGVIMPAVDVTDEEVETELKRWISQNRGGTYSDTDLELLRKQVRERMLMDFQMIPPGFIHEWDLDVSDIKHNLKDKRLHIRARFNIAEEIPGASFTAVWAIGPPDEAKLYTTKFIMAPAANYDFEIPENLYDEEGILSVRFLNDNPLALQFPLDTGLQLFYPESTFGINFLRGILILFLWLAFLAALGLAASSYLSFPVASFVAAAILIVMASSDTIALVLYQGSVFAPNQNTGKADSPTLIDHLAIPIFRVMLEVINMVKVFSPIEALSTGRSIPWFQVGRAILQIGVVMCGLLALIGIGAFTRRELAAEQSNH